MNNKTNYTIVGFLVLVGLGLMMAFGYWLLKPSDEKETKRYGIYFSESVSGLNLDAPVKYKGVSVGKVVKLGINSKNKREVEVVVEMLKTTPITTSTVAVLTSQGITGLSYINLTHQRGDESKTIEKLEDEEYPIIKSAPSLFAKAENVLEGMFINIDQTLQKLNTLLDGENQKSIADILKNSADITSKINTSLDSGSSISSTLQNIESMTKKMDDMLFKIEKFIDNSIEWEDKISGSFGSVAQSYVGIQSAMDEFKKAIADGQIDMKSLAGDTLHNLNITMQEMQNLMQQTSEILHEYEKSPADMIFLQQETKKAPGE
ncbi:MAG: MlaD family protein [Sulfurimonas sp.]|jgi:phospholipid/cholesterol/gamma-HCH transport system substrate-binding protein|nr:MlaD family protein [Sulfurimonadaceae bacterium]